MKRNALPSVERLNEVFQYCAATGALIWKVQPRGRGRKGDAAGGLTPIGYTQVVIDRRHFLAHRIIWKMQTGQEPPTLIDHIDGNIANNSWANLREASPTGNSCNSKRRSDNTSGVKGVSYDSERRKWRSYVIHEYKQHEAGRFDCFGRAIKAMRDMRLRLHGEFARAA